jgi:hypothetical protein
MPRLQQIDRSYRHQQNEDREWKRNIDRRPPEKLYQQNCRNYHDSRVNNETRLQWQWP